MKLSSLISGPIKDYSLEVLYNRAVPNVIDGLKPSQRKILYAALRTCANKKIKTISLTGNVISQACYHHGDASLNEAIVKMVQDFKNNVPLLAGEGSFGSRLVQEAAQPRYTFVSMAMNDYNKYFSDNNICPENPDPENPEPLFYLPKIPWLLVNGSNGIAVGFTSKILMRNPKDIAAACREYMTTGKVKNKLVPSYPKFNGKFIRDKDDANKWTCCGSFTKNSPTKLTITELPVEYSRIKYVEILEGLVEAGKIVTYSDKCSSKGFEFVVTLPRKKSVKYTDAALLSLLKLKKIFQEKLTTISTEGKLLIFNNPAEIIAYFCDYRLKKYKERYKKAIIDAKIKRNKLKAKYLFIYMVLENKISLKNKTKAQLKTELKSLKHFSECDIDALLDIPIYQFCADELVKLQKDIRELDTNIELWYNIDIEKQYINELKEIK